MANGGPQAEQAARLHADGARLLLGMISDTGGVLRAKAVPAARIESFATSGMGASPSWAVFCADNHVAFTPEIGVVGDVRLVADLAAARVLDDGFAVAPADVRTQDGDRSGLCWRDVARRAERRLADDGIQTLAGYEMEFVLTDLTGNRLGELGWPAYGLGVLSELSSFTTEVAQALAAAGCPAEQLHAEYGTGQFELSLPPAPPVVAADAVLLARSVVSRVGRRHGLRASFSPKPFPDSAGNGGHLHLSFTATGRPLLSGGAESAGLTETGAQLIAGLVDGLVETIAVLAGSAVSADRLQPGTWSGAYSCWGVENREAAVRLLTATRGNPHGANVEIKCIDSAANPYLAIGLMLGMAHDGLVRRLTLPAAVDADPTALDAEQSAAAQLRRLPVTMAQALSEFACSVRAQQILGPQLHSALVAVREHELELSQSPDRYALTRFVWSA